jgi:hypothetical protein
MTGRILCNDSSPSIYKQTRTLLTAQILLSHTKFASTVRARGIGVEDAFTLAESTVV